MEKRYLTGRFFHRRTWLGWLVLMVEEKHEYTTGGGSNLQTFWRKAEDEDLMELKLKNSAR